MDRTRAWLAAAPLLAAGVVLAHLCAYRLTATPTGPAHDYLAHAPQVLVLLAVVGAALAAFTSGRREPALWAFPLAGLAAFGIQEHLEALAHAGAFPFLLDSPAFLVGLALQLPFAAGAWLLARALLRAPAEPRRPRPRRPRALLVIEPPPVWAGRALAVRPLPGRGPPALLRP